MKTCKVCLSENLDLMVEISEKIKAESGIEPAEADIDLTEDEEEDVDA